MTSENNSSSPESAVEPVSEESAGGGVDVDDGDSSTSSTRIRWKYTNDVLAFVILTAHIGVLVASLRYGFDVPQAAWQVFVLEVVIAATWTFGPGTLRAARDAWKGDSSSSSTSERRPQ